MVVAVLDGGCLVAPEPQANKPSLISSLEAQYANVYPMGSTEIRCIASAPEGDEVQLKWSSTGGTFIGDGPTVTWRAPNDYGDYHIMVVAKDNDGSSAEATTTISVVARPYKGCCGR